MRLCSFLLLLPAALLRAQAPPATLDGNVIDSVTGAPIPFARVKLVAGKSEPQYGAADARGHFHFDNVSGPGRALTVEHLGYLPYSLGARDAFQSTVKVALTAGAILYGTVTDPNGLPASPGGAFMGQILEQRPIDPRSPRGQPLPDGKNELTVTSAMMIDDRGQYRSGLLAPGIYYVAVLTQRAPDFWDRTWRSTYYPHALDAESAKPIVLSPGQQVRADIQVIRQAGVHVSGRVAVPSYEPPPPGMDISTRVYLVHRGFLTSQSASSAVTAERFEASDLMPGNYNVVAETQEMSTDGTARNAKSLFGTLRQVEIGERDVSDLDLELQPLAEVTGKVTFAGGCATAPVRVLVTSGSIMGVKEYSVLTGPDGAFAFGTFTPGPLHIGATGPGQASVWLGDRDITISGFDYPTPTPQELRVAISCGGGAR